MTDSTRSLTTDETELIAQAQQGDEQAFGELAGLHRAALTGYCRRIMIVEEDAEDAAQDVLSKAWVSLGQFRSQAPFKHWLFGIARNVCLDARKSNRTVCNLDILDDIPDTRGDTMADSVVSRLFARDVIDLIKKTAYSRRPPWDATDLTMFLLRYLHGMTHSEIAQYLGVNENSSRSRFNRKVKRVVDWVCSSLTNDDR
jgi:RNA polymerase sigma-70 factor (ECF subfamily)